MSVEVEMARMTREFEVLIRLIKPWVSIDEMCERYDCSKRTIYRMVETQKLPAPKNGRWDRSELLQWESK